MTVPIIHVDTFVDKGLRGNAAAVCVLSRPAEPSWMQSIAHEMNVSETAFFYQESDGFHLCWFSPLVEVGLCGHGTLAVWMAKLPEERTDCLPGLISWRCAASSDERRRLISQWESGYGGRGELNIALSTTTNV